jgi:hypothetical protein
MASTEDEIERTWAVRVEIPELTPSEYAELNSAMWREGFRRFFVDGSGKMRLLPAGSFAIVMSRSLQDEISVKLRAALSQLTFALDYDFIVFEHEVTTTYNSPVIETDPDAFE